MSEQTKLREGHRVLFGNLEDPWHRDPIVWVKFVEPFPTFDRPEFVVAGRADSAAQFGRELENWFRPGRKCIRDGLRVHPPPLLIECQHPKAALANELPNGHIRAAIGQKDRCISRQAAGLAEVAQDRALVGALFWCTPQLRDCS